MSLSERLRRLGAVHTLVGDIELPEPGPATDPAGITGADICSNKLGTFLMRDSFYRLEHLHGAFPLSEALGCDSRVLGMLARDRRMAAFDLSRALFLDTETTGLSGGTGTVPFLVGVAGYEPGGFRVRQLFMRDYDEEPALLHHLAMILEERSGLVTYNGKTFDMPLLTTRFVANRQQVPDVELPHLDLLHTARRIWRHELPELSLQHVEKSILSVMRVDDIPGMMIPALYFRYLRSKRFELMEPVLSHNLLDLLSLVSVIAAAARACRGEGQRGGECFGVGRTLDSMKEHQDAVGAYRRALGMAREPGLERAISKALARALGRTGDHAAAAKTLEALADRWEDLDALEGLAKWAEHRVKDWALALGYVERALARLHSPLLRAVPAVAARREAFHARKARLQRKLAEPPRARSSRRGGERHVPAGGVQEQ